MGFTVVSLFSGAGGLDLGFKQAGFEIVFANDIMLPAASTFSKNMGLKLEVCSKEDATASPGRVLVCDVAQVDFAGLAGIEVDVVAGGPPCQDFSIVRGPPWDRKGIEVKRGQLYAHFVRALAILQPKVFVFENVPGLISANGGLAYKVILDDLTNLKARWPEVERIINEGNDNEVEGYEIVFAGLVDFSRLGVPQKRERLIIIGVRRDLVEGRGVLPDLKKRVGEVLRGEPWLFRRYPLTPLEVFEGRRLDELDGKYREVMKKWEGVWNEVGTRYAFEWKRKVWDRLAFNIVEDYLFVNNIKQHSKDELEEALRQHEAVLKELGYLGKRIEDLKLPDGTCEIPRDDPRVAERLKRIPPDENHEFVRGTRWEVEGRGISLVYRRIHPLKPAYTVVAYGGGGTHGYHYDRDRATLTLREKARLQTFPDTFLFTGSRAEIRAQIGEAVPPLAAKRIAEAVALILSEVA